MTTFLKYLLNMMLVFTGFTMIYPIWVTFHSILFNCTGDGYCLIFAGFCMLYDIIVLITVISNYNDIKKIFN